jgi:methylenetetrahydrofolate reductase (NADPH)
MDPDTEVVPSNLAIHLRNYSIELNPREPKAIAAAPERLDPGTEVYLTWVPGANPMDVVAPASFLRRAGLNPVPHIGARHIESASQLERLMARLVAEAEVDRVLIIGADRNRPAGPFDSSLAVMESGLLQKAGILRMSIGGFPEGNPKISDAVLEEALAAKVNFAHSAGLQLSIMTQFCFEAEPVVAWLHRVRAMGIDVPVRIGLAGPAGLVTLMRYAVHCGVGNSLKVLTDKPSFARLLIEKGPEPILRGIISALPPPSPDALPFGIAGFHFFVFGGLKKTMEWIDNYRARPGQAPH